MTQILSSRYVCQVVSQLDTFFSDTFFLAEIKIFPNLLQVMSYFRFLHCFKSFFVLSFVLKAIQLNNVKNDFIYIKQSRIALVLLYHLLCFANEYMKDHIFELRRKVWRHQWFSQALISFFSGFNFTAAYVVFITAMITDVFVLCFVWKHGATS